MGDFFQAIGNFFGGAPEVPEYTLPAEQAPQIDYSAQYRTAVEKQMAAEKKAATASASAKSAKRAGTILTGPRGIQDQGVAVGKTLLGQ